MHIRSSRDLADVVRAYRKAAGLSQARLAEVVGTSQRWISELEKGKSTAEVGLVLRTLLAVGIKLDVPPPGQPPATTGFGSPTITQYPDINDIIERGKR